MFALHNCFTCSWMDSMVAIFRWPLVLSCVYESIERLRITLHIMLVLETCPNSLVYLFWTSKVIYHIQVVNIFPIPLRFHLKAIHPKSPAANHQPFQNAWSQNTAFVFSILCMMFPKLCDVEPTFLGLILPMSRSQVLVNLNCVTAWV